jgi:hypothetical protein
LDIQIKAVHDKIKKHKCTYCEHVTSSKANMSRHIKSMHNKIIEDKNCDNAVFQKVESVAKQVKKVCGPDQK